MNTVQQQYDYLYNLINASIGQMYELWLTNVFLTPLWWLGVALTLLPWIAWFFVRKKELTDSLLYAAFSVMIIASYTDYLGVSLGLWSYYYEVLPFTPAFFPWDLTILPVVTMFFLQIKPDFSPFIKSIIYSFLGSFILQPFAVWIGLYNPKVWKHYYSFPILILIYYIAYYFYKRNERR